jgi:hypothetical protein
MSAESLDDPLKKFPHTRFHPEARLFTWHPQGLLDDALADKIVDFIEEETLAASLSCHCYTDFSGLSEIRLKIGHLFQIAERRRNAELPRKSAFFAQSAVGFGIARMYEELMKAASIEVRAFREREAAAEWLGVPIEILGEEPPAISQQP